MATFSTRTRSLSMPDIPINTPTGPISIHYNILTPTSSCAETIAPDLATIVFLHSVYMAQEVFEPQASDPLLRRFNLVFIDLRGHGTTTGRVGSPYRPTETADDVYRVMRYLNLPPSHLFGLSIGGAAALELAILHPELVLSLTLCSPLPPEEPEIAISGREESFEYYSQSLKDAPDIIVKDLIDDAVYGIMQMIFSNTTSTRINALKEVALVHVLRNWGWEKEKLQDGYGIVNTWFATRKRLTEAELSTIRCPIQLIHCDNDIPYPEECVREIQKELVEAGLKVTWNSIHGPHFGSFTNPAPVNRILHDLVVSTSAKPGPPLPDSTHAPMMTPFHDALGEHGYYDDDEDSDFE